MAEEERPVEPPAPPKQSQGMFSPVAYLVILMLLAVDGVIVWYLTKNWSSAGASVPSIAQNYVQVDLGLVSRDLPGDNLGMRHEKFAARVALKLNPAYGDLKALQVEVEKRRDELKHIINVEIILRKNPEEFRKPNFLDNLSREIQLRLNQELGSSDTGQEIIIRVLFPEVPHLPLPR